MEKHTPHHRLSEVKQLVFDGRLRHTKVAVHGAKALGFTTADIALVVQGLERKDFYKSMTCFGDHTICRTSITRGHAAGLSISS